VSAEIFQFPDFRDFETVEIGELTGLPPGPYYEDGKTDLAVHAETTRGTVDLVLWAENRGAVPIAIAEMSPQEACDVAVWLVDAAERIGDTDE
jgi:hypothetical protein